ncbi:hypothetical protein B0H13DRAFT_1007651 [Mycena leptocephala]|nr:hypothetical protein B0H13DRAFT_1007651 [Mycena leptocephala]
MMENDDHSENNEFTSNSGGELPEFSSASYHYGGGIFSGSHNFTVAGGTFNVSNNYTSAPTVPSDFRMIPLGDIDLQHELRLNKGSAVVGRRCERASVRRVYSARIEGRNAPMTVAMYQGPGAEEEWRQDVAKHMSVRHPNMVQMFRAASSGGVHATFFHGDLIPYHHFLDLYRHSPVLTMYIRAFCFGEMDGVREYFRSIFQTYLDDRDCTIWIRRSTGRVCADLVPGNFSLGALMSHERPTLDQWQQLFSVNVPHMEAMVIDSLTLEQFHAICCWDQSSPWGVSMNQRTVHLGAILVKSGSDWDYLDEVVSSRNIIILPHWRAFSRWDRTPARGEVIEDGWTRFDSGDVSDNMIQLHMDLPSEQPFESWLSQANHIFSRRGINSDFTDYGFVQAVFFSIIVSEAVEPCPQGYLFVCPEKDLLTGPSSFRLPDCPAYWSLDPSGAERLSPEEAAELGFPSIKLDIYVLVLCWNADVYTALRQFHQAKGFDPDSQDVARHLGYPLFQLTSAVDALFAHVDDADIDSQEDGQDPDTGGENINQVHESTAANEELGLPSLCDAMPVSRTSTFFKNIQGMLFLLLALSWLYAQLW